MKIRTIVTVACLALFGWTQVADARPHARRHTTKKSMSGGVNTSTGDVNGDGSSAVVVPPKPKRQPYPGMSQPYPGSSMMPKDFNGDGIPDAATAPKSRTVTTTPKPKPKSVPSGGGVTVQ